jgi:hypothetical protein
MGETDAKGQFTLTYDPETKGAERGTHKVFVMHNPANDAIPADAIPGMPSRMSSDLKEFFSKYNGEQSKVTVTIDKAISDLKLSWE